MYLQYNYLIFKNLNKIRVYKYVKLFIRGHGQDLMEKKYVDLKKHLCLNIGSH